jgi:thymidylate kinase
MNNHDLSWAAGYETVALDGCDGAGKTTLAARLHAEHGFAIVHADRTPEHLDLSQRYHEILAGPGRIVLDRCFLSELVYGPLYYGRSRLTWDQCLDLITAVVDRAGVFVHVTATPTTIHARLNERSDGHSPSLAEIGQISAGYVQIFDQLKLRIQIVEIDTTPR